MPGTRSKLDSPGVQLAVADFALSAGFGTTASLTVAAGSTDQRGQIVITSSGTGQGANPTCTLTFRDGQWARTPFAVVCRGGTGSQPTVPFNADVTAAALTLTFQGTPVAAQTYTVNWYVAD
jgi:hypothetical protein